MIHAPLKNIFVEIKSSAFRNHGFSKLVVENNKRKADIIRTHEKQVVPAGA